MIKFSDSQNRAVASGLTAVAVAAVAAFALLVAWGVLKVLAFAAPAIVPVILGFFLALFFRPYFQWWRRTVRNPTLALLLMGSTVLVPIVFVVWHAGALIVSQILSLIDQGPRLVEQVVNWFRVEFPQLHSLLMQIGVPYDDVGYIYTKYEAVAMKAGGGAIRLFSAVVTSVVTLIFLVFFLMSEQRRGGEITAHMPFLKEDTRDFLAAQIDAFVEILVSFFQRQAVICLIEGLMYGTGFMLVGLPYGFLVGFALGVMNLIPLFGSIVCLPVALPLAYFHQGGSQTRLLLVLAVWLVGQVLDGYLITPRIQGNKTGLGYAGVIFSFFFWSIILGPVLGMLLAIPLSAFCVVFWRAVKSRYIRPVV